MGLDGCPTHEELTHYLEQAHQRDPRDSDATADHIAGCVLCRRALDDPTHYEDTLRWRQLWDGAAHEVGIAETAGSSPAHATWSSETLDVPFELEGYQILGVLGRGGSGVVYKAVQRKLNRVVALKVLAAGVHASAKAVARFRAESEMIAGLAHPNVVAIHDVGEHQGVPYLCLEFVEGGSLADWLRERTEPIEPRTAARVVAGLARVVQSAHERGVVHRDLKPANVLLGKSESGELDPERLKLTDFGLAKRLGADMGEAVSLSGVVLGTPAYMAPEQAGRRKGEVGPTADVYSLGAILYELLTLQPPFRGDSPIEVVLDVVMKSPVPPSRLRAGIPKELETLCLRCLDKDPLKRPRSAAGLAEELEGIDASPYIYGFSRSGRRGRILAGSLGACTLLSAALAMFSYLRSPFTESSASPSIVAREIKMTLPPSTSTRKQGDHFDEAGMIELSPPVIGLAENERRIAFDLRDDRHKEYLYEAGTKNARVWTEKKHDVRYWGPIDDAKWFQVVYRFPFDFTVRSATLFAGVERAEDGAKGIIEVSTDPDQGWQELSLGGVLPQHGGPVDVSDLISGARVVYVRARMKGRDDGNQSAMAQFLRTSIYPHGNLEFKSPHVFELRAFDRDVPIVTAGLTFDDGWERSLWIASDGQFRIDRLFERTGMHKGAVTARARGVRSRTSSFEIWVNSKVGKIEVDPRELVVVPGLPYVVRGRLTGGGPGPWLGEVDYKDGSGCQTFRVMADATFELNHQYVSLGTYHPRITITNNSGEMWTDFPRCHVIADRRPSKLE